MTWRVENSSHNMNLTHSNGNKGYAQQDSRHESNDTIPTKNGRGLMEK